MSGYLICVRCPYDASAADDANFFDRCRVMYSDPPNSMDMSGIDKRPEIKDWFNACSAKKMRDLGEIRTDLTQYKGFGTINGNYVQISTMPIQKDRMEFRVETVKDTKRAWNKEELFNMAEALKDVLELRYGHKVHVGIELRRVSHYN